MSEFKINRRTFVGGAVGFCAAAPLGLKFSLQEEPILPVRQRQPNPWVENDKPVVAAITGTSYAAMLAKGLELLGGFARFGSGKPVMLKPNFILPEAYPTTTDGPSILATVEALNKEGFNDISVADGGHRRSTKTEAVAFYNLEEKAAAGGFKNLHLLEDEVVKVKHDGWTAMKTAGVFKSAYESPIMINMPVIKQHPMTVYTCALKNLMGPVDLPTRMFLHGVPQRLQGEERLKNAKLCVAEIASAVNPEITIIDARQVMGKNAYRPGGGVIIDTNMLIISGDSMAAELMAAKVLAKQYPDFQPSSIDDTLGHATALGLGVAGLDDVVLKEATV